MTTGTEKGTKALVERFMLKALVECCRLVEEDVAGVKDIDLGMMTGAGVVPGPLQRADERGLDEVVEALERAQAEWGPDFSPPRVLRRLVAQRRLGRKTGQGFFPYPQPIEERETLGLEERDGVAIVWLNRPPTNPISPQVIIDLAEVWRGLDGEAPAVVITSSTPFAFSAGADIKEFQRAAEGGGEELVDSAHSLMRSMETSSTVTIAAVNAVALGGGCELAMGCDLRIAARSATFGQPEINLGILPGFGGTQRLPRLVGEGKALELSLTGEPIGADEAARLGLVNQVVRDHELLDTALAWGRELASKAPIAIEQIKKTVSHSGDLDEGLQAEKEGFGRAFGSEDAREGISAFLEKRTPRFHGK